MTNVISNTAFIENLQYHGSHDDSRLPSFYSNEIKEIFRGNKIKDTLEYARELGGQELVNKTLNIFKAYINLQAQQQQIILLSLQEV